jgi:hypothetical protein
LAGNCLRAPMTIGSSMHVWFWQTPSWNWAEFWALVVLLPFVAWPVKVPKRVQPGGAPATRHTIAAIALANGKDGRWSTSRTTMLLWTYSVWFAFVAILLHTNGAGIADAVLKQQYLILLGVPAAAAVIAQGITQSKVNNNTIMSKQTENVVPETNVIAGVGQLVGNDVGQADLLDFQYFGFNLILLGYFFTRFLGHAGFGLPELPDTLVALSGVSAAAYVGKKGVEADTPPTIRSVLPRSAAPKDTFMVRGVNFATATQTADVGVLVGDLKADVSSVTVGDFDCTLVAVVPEKAVPGPAPVSVVNYQGLTTIPYDFTIT